MTKATLELLQLAHTGAGRSEIIKLKLVPLEDLWREAPDAKALSSLFLYTKFLEFERKKVFERRVSKFCFLFFCWFLFVFFWFFWFFGFLFFFCFLGFF
jgi:hypothetical protein